MLMLFDIYVYVILKIRKFSEKESAKWKAEMETILSNKETQPVQKTEITKN